MPVILVKMPLRLCACVLLILVANVRASCPAGQYTHHPEGQEPQCIECDPGKRVELVEEATTVPNPYGATGTVSSTTVSPTFAYGVAPCYDNSCIYFSTDETKVYKISSSSDTKLVPNANTETLVLTVSWQGDTHKFHVNLANIITLFTTSDEFIYLCHPAGSILEYRTSDYTLASSATWKNTFGSTMVQDATFTMSYDETYIAFIIKHVSTKTFTLMIFTRNPLTEYRREVAENWNDWYTSRSINKMMLSFIHGTHDFFIASKWQTDTSEIRKLTWDEMEAGKLKDVIWEYSSSDAKANSVALFTSDTTYQGGFVYQEFYKYWPLNIFVKPNTNDVFLVSYDRDIFLFDMITWENKMVYRVAELGQDYKLAVMSAGGDFILFPKRPRTGTFEIGIFSTGDGTLLTMEPTCTPCPAGYRCLDSASDPIACEAGSFSEAGATTCLPCPVDTFAATEPEVKTLTTSNPDPFGYVTTLVGDGEAGDVVGSFAESKLNYPFGIDILPGGSRALLVDRSNYKVKLLDLHTEAVSTLATFDSRPADVCVDPSGEVAYVTTSSDTIYQINMANGVVQVFLTTSASNLWGCVVSNDGFLVYSDVAAIHEVSISDPTDTFSYSNTANCNMMVINAVNNHIYYQDTTQYKIYKIDRSSRSNTRQFVAGDGTYASGEGTASSSSFKFPRGLALSSDGNILYVTSHSAIMQINLAGDASASDYVTKVAGQLGSTDHGFVDGGADTAKLYGPIGLDIAPNDAYLLTAELYTHAVRKISLGNDIQMTVTIMKNTCEACEPFSVSIGGAVTSCTCVEGYYALAETPCTACPAGLFCANASAPPVPCAPGSYSNATATACTDCAVDFFAATEGSAACTPCDSNGWTNGETGSAKCLCVAGFFEETICNPCPANSTTTLQEQNANNCACQVPFEDPTPIVCPNNIKDGISYKFFYLSRCSADDCAISGYMYSGYSCEQYCSNFGLTCARSEGPTCYDHSEYEFGCDEVITSSTSVYCDCSGKERFYESINVGASEVCTACPAGSFCANASAPPVPCAPGSYSNASATACTDCAVDFFADTEGSAACTPCDSDGWTNGETGLESCYCIPGLFWGSPQIDVSSAPLGITGELSNQDETTKSTPHVYFQVKYGQSQIYWREDFQGDRKAEMFAYARKVYSKSDDWVPGMCNVECNWQYYAMYVRNIADLTEPCLVTTNIRSYSSYTDCASVASLSYSVIQAEFPNDTYLMMLFPIEGWRNPPADNNGGIDTARALAVYLHRYSSDGWNDEVWVVNSNIKQFDTNFWDAGNKKVHWNSYNAIQSLVPITPTGKYSLAPDCLTCMDGYYCPGDNSKLECPAFGQPNVERTGCDCVPGSYFDSGTLNCTLCSLGTSSNATGATSCTACLPGFYADERGMTSCIECPEGFSCSDPTLTPRARVNVQTTLGMSLAAFTAAIRQSFLSFVAAAAKVSEEAVVITSVTESTAARRRLLNTDSNSIDVVTRIDILDGSTIEGVQESLTEDSLKAEMAQSDAFSGVSVSIAIEVDGVCDKGSYAPVGATSCVPCLPGSHAADFGMTECTACIPGKYSPQPGAIECLQCQFNTYQPLQNQTACRACPVNSESLAGSTALSACECAMGYENSGVVEPQSAYCSACAIGKFKEVTSPDPCSPCHASSSTFTEGTMLATECDCLPGFTKESICAPCPSNSTTTLQEQNENNCACQVPFEDPAPIDCPDSWLTGVGGLVIRKEVCSDHECSAHVGFVSGVSCSDYCSGRGTGLICRNAYKGSCSEQLEEIGCADMNGGSDIFCDCSGKEPFYESINVGETEACSACSADTYKPDMGDQFCTDCPPNTVSDAQSEALTDCKSDLGYTGADGVAGSACAVGTYKDIIGSSDCTSCPANASTANPAAGNIDLCLCKAGLFLEGDACATCPIGYYKTALSDAPCTQCPPKTNTVVRGGDSIDFCLCEEGKSLQSMESIQEQPAFEYLDFHVTDATELENFPSAGSVDVSPSELGLTFVVRFEVYDGMSSGRQMLLNAQHTPNDYSARQFEIVWDPSSSSNVVYLRFIIRNGGSACGDSNTIDSIKLPSVREFWTFIVRVDPVTSTKSKLMYSLFDGSGEKVQDFSDQQCLTNLPTVTYSGIYLGKSGHKFHWEHYYDKISHAQIYNSALSTETLHQLALQLNSGDSAGTCENCAADTYKDFISNGDCKSCPENTWTMHQDMQVTIEGCVCAPGWFPDISYELTLTDKNGKYFLDSDSLYATANPVLEIVRGQSFVIHWPAGHPVVISDTAGHGAQAVAFATRDDTAQTTTVTVPGDYGGDLYYYCEFHSSMQGTVQAKHVQCVTCLENHYCTGIQLPPELIWFAEKMSGDSHTWTSAQNWAVERGGRLATTQEIQAYVVENDDGFLSYVPSYTGDMYVATTNELSTNNGMDVVQVGRKSGNFNYDYVTYYPSFVANIDAPSSAVYASYVVYVKETMPSQEPTACPAHRTSPPGSYHVGNCTCAPGYTLEIGPENPTCVACSKGTYKELSGNHTCTECPSHTYQDELAATNRSQCKSCMPFSETEETTGHESIHACMCLSGYFHATRTTCERCLPGTFNPDKNQTQCSNCSAGSASNAYNASDVTTCKQCPAGFYSREGANLCTKCNVNATSAPGSTAVTDCKCDPGFSGPDGGHCQECAIAFYKETHGSHACTACHAFSSTHARGSRFKEDCDCLPGAEVFVDSDGFESCSQCLHGTFKPSFSDTSCLSCPQHTNSTVGSVNLTQCRCIPGYTGPDGEECSACAIAKFKPSAGSSSCTFCPENSTTFQTAQSDFSACQCLAGFDGSDIATSGCKECSVGFYKEIESNDACQQCQDLTSTVHVQSQSVDDCQCVPGRFLQEPSTPCAKCEAGKYKDFVSNAQCTDCPSFTFSGEGSDSNLNCSCNMGFTGPDGVACTACPIATYKDVNGSSACTACPDNSTTFSSASVSFDSCTCEEGYDGVLIDTKGCRACEIGFFKDRIANLPCTQCSEHTTTEEDGAHEMSLCECVPGRFRDEDTMTCEKCDLGTFKNFVGNQSCDQCAHVQEGTFSLQLGSDALEMCNCTAGFESTAGGSGGGNCQPCGAGDFKNISGNYQCESCPAGTFTEVYERGLNDTSQCSLCQDGKTSNPINNGAGVESCIGACPPGWTGLPFDPPTDANPAGGCQMCADGKYKATTGSEPCTICPANSDSQAAFFPEPPTGLVSVTNEVRGWDANQGYADGEESNNFGPMQINLATAKGFTLSARFKILSVNSLKAILFYVGMDTNSWDATLIRVLYRFDVQTHKFQYKMNEYEIKQEVALGEEVEYVIKYDAQMQQISWTVNQVTQHFHASLSLEDKFFDHVYIGRDRYKYSQYTEQSYWAPTALKGEIVNFAFYEGVLSDGDFNPKDWGDFVPRSYCLCNAGFSGTETPLSDSDCTACSAGSYKSEIGWENCTLCQAGTYNVNQASTTPEACLVCGLGKYNPETGSDSADACLECARGKYQDKFGQSALSACVDCAQGKYAESLELGLDESICRECPAGKYAETTGNFHLSNCTLCHAGTYAESVENTNKDDCLQCPQGKWSSATGADEASDCHSCVRGKYQELTGQTSESDCLLCTAGKSSAVLASTDANDCTACAIGRYAFAGSSTCTACSDNSSTAGRVITYVGATTSEACVSCAAGEQYLNDSLCLTCVAGKHSASDLDRAQGASCIDCGGGLFSTQVGADSAETCQACSPGTFAEKLSGSSVCLDCAAGKFREQPAALSPSDCQDCPENTYSGTIAAASSSTCLPCPDRYSSVEGSTNESQCLLICPPGKTGPDGDCSHCPQATYKSIYGSSACLPCPTLASPEPGARACVCNPGYVLANASHVFDSENPDWHVQSDDGNPTATQCRACNAGTYSLFDAVAKRTNCEACSRGTYSGAEAQFNVSTCESCPEGKNSLAGSTVVEDCEDVCMVGETGPFEACEACADGFFKNTIGPDECMQCEASAKTQHVFVGRRTRCVCQAGHEPEQVFGQVDHYIEVIDNATLDFSLNTSTAMLAEQTHLLVVPGSYELHMVPTPQGVEWRNLSHEADTVNLERAYDIYSLFVPTSVSATVQLALQSKLTGLRGVPKDVTFGDGETTTEDVGPISKTPVATFQPEGMSSFDRSQSQFLSLDPITIKFTSHGGVTVITKFRFTGPANRNEGLFFLGSSTTARLDDPSLYVHRYNSGASFGVALTMGGWCYWTENTGTGIESYAFSQETWTTMVVRWSQEEPTYVYLKINGKEYFSLGCYPTVPLQTQDREFDQVYIGKSYQDGTFMNGDIAGLYIFDYGLTDAEVQAVADSIVVPSGAALSGQQPDLSQVFYGDWPVAVEDDEVQEGQPAFEYLDFHVTDATELQNFPSAGAVDVSPSELGITFVVRFEVFRDMPSGRQMLFTAQHNPNDWRAKLFEIVWEPTAVLNKVFFSYTLRDGGNNFCGMNKNFDMDLLPPVRQFWTMVAIMTQFSGTRSNLFFKLYDGSGEQVEDFGTTECIKNMPAATYSGIYLGKNAQNEEHYYDKISHAQIYNSGLSNEALDQLVSSFSKPEPAFEYLDFHVTDATELQNVPSAGSVDVSPSELGITFVVRFEVFHDMPSGRQMLFTAQHNPNDWRAKLFEIVWEPTAVLNKVFFSYTIRDGGNNFCGMNKNFDMDLLPPVRQFWTVVAIMTPFSGTRSNLFFELYDGSGKQVEYFGTTECTKNMPTATYSGIYLGKNAQNEEHYYDKISHAQIYNLALSTERLNELVLQLNGIDTTGSEDGTSALTLNAKCTACSLGKYKSVAGNIMCEDCPRGSRAVVTEDADPTFENTCKLCVQGRYQSAPGQTSCHLCPSGSYGAPASSNSSLKCAGGWCDMVQCSCTNESIIVDASSPAACRQQCDVLSNNCDSYSFSGGVCCLGAERTQASGARPVPPFPHLVASVSDYKEVTTEGALSHNDKGPIVLGPKTNNGFTIVAKFKVDPDLGVNDAGLINLWNCDAYTLNNAYWQRNCLRLLLKYSGGSFSHIETRFFGIASGIYNLPNKATIFDNFVFMIYTFKENKFDVSFYDEDFELIDRRESWYTIDVDNIGAQSFSVGSINSQSDGSPEKPLFGEIPILDVFNAPVSDEDILAFYNPSAPPACFQRGVVNRIEADDSCSRCPIGSYSLYENEHVSASSCAKCPAGKYSETLGASSTEVCLDCPAGKYLEQAGMAFSGSCVSCRAGTFSVSTGAISEGTCSACLAGKFSTTVGAQSAETCIDCGAGKYQPVTGAAQESACLDCKAGTFNLKNGSLSENDCLQCQAGTYSNVSGLGSACAGACPAGTYSTETGLTSPDQCLDCAVGQYQNSTGQTLCLECHPGTFTVTNGTVLCQECLPGSKCPAPDQLPQDCPKGSSSFKKAVQCFACDAGKFTDEPGMPACVECPGGFACVATDESPSLCLSGTYSNSGATTCSNCGLGWHGVSALVQADQGVQCLEAWCARDTGCGGEVYATVQGSEAEKCRDFCDLDPKCNAVSFNGSGLQCLLFSNFTEHGQNSSSASNNCHFRGTHARSSFVSSCISCPAGTASALTNLAVREGCSLCGAGLFSDQLNSSACTQCPAGRHGTLVGARQPVNSSCPLCLAGKYSSSPGQSSCFNCPKQTYSEVVGSTSISNCASCSPNKYSNVEGSGNNTCKMCGANLWMSLNTTSLHADCVPCGANKASPVGSTSADACLCEAGWASAGSECEPCSESHFCPGLNAKVPCPGNMESPAGSVNLGNCSCMQGFVPVPAGGCESCLKGQYIPAGESECYFCLPNYWCDGINMHACPDKSTSLPGANVRGLSPYSLPDDRGCSCIDGYDGNLSMPLGECTECAQPEYCTVPDEKVEIGLKIVENIFTTLSAEEINTLAAQAWQRLSGGQDTGETPDVVFSSDYKTEFALQKDQVVFSNEVLAEMASIVAEEAQERLKQAEQVFYLEFAGEIALSSGVGLPGCTGPSGTMQRKQIDTDIRTQVRDALSSPPFASTCVCEHGESDSQCQGCLVAVIAVTEIAGRAYDFKVTVSVVASDFVTDNGDWVPAYDGWLDTALQAVSVSTYCESNLNTVLQVKDGSIENCEVPGQCVDADISRILNYDLLLSPSCTSCYNETGCAASSHSICSISAETEAPSSRRLLYAGQRCFLVSYEASAANATDVLKFIRDESTGVWAVTKSSVQERQTCQSSTGCLCDAGEPLENGQTSIKIGVSSVSRSQSQNPYKLSLSFTLAQGLNDTETDSVVDKIGLGMSDVLKEQGVDIAPPQVEFEGSNIDFVYTGSLTALLQVQEEARENTQKFLEEQGLTAVVSSFDVSQVSSRCLLSENKDLFSVDGELQCLCNNISVVDPRGFDFACIECANGTYASDDRQSCLMCEGGFWCSRGKRACPGGGISAPGSSDVAACVPASHTRVSFDVFVHSPSSLAQPPRIMLEGIDPREFVSQTIHLAEAGVEQAFVQDQGFFSRWRVDLEDPSVAIEFTTAAVLGYLNMLPSHVSVLQSRDPQSGAYNVTFEATTFVQDAWLNRALRLFVESASATTVANTTILQAGFRVTGTVSSAAKLSRLYLAPIRVSLQELYAEGLSFDVQNFSFAEPPPTACVNGMQLRNGTCECPFPFAFDGEGVCTQCRPGTHRADMTEASCSVCPANHQCLPETDMLPVSCEEVAGGMISMPGNPCRCPDLHFVDQILRKCVPCTPEQNCDAYETASFVTLAHAAFPTEQEAAAVSAAVGANGGCAGGSFLVSLTITTDPVSVEDSAEMHKITTEATPASINSALNLPTRAPSSVSIKSQISVKLNINSQQDLDLNFLAVLLRDFSVNTLSLPIPTVTTARVPSTTALLFTASVTFVVHQDFTGVEVVSSYTSLGSSFTVDTQNGRVQVEVGNIEGQLDADIGVEGFAALDDILSIFSPVLLNGRASSHSTVRQCLRSAGVFNASALSSEFSTLVVESINVTDVMKAPCEYARDLAGDCICKPGQVPSAESSACVDCPPGFFSNLDTECRPCEDGYFCPGGSMQRACPVSSVTLGVARSVQDCQCIEGFARVSEKSCRQCSLWDSLSQHPDCLNPIRIKAVVATPILNYNLAFSSSSSALQEFQDELWADVEGSLLQAFNHTMHELALGDVADDIEARTRYTVEITDSLRTPASRRRLLSQGGCEVLRSESLESQASSECSFYNNEFELPLLQQAATALVSSAFNDPSCTAHVTSTGGFQHRWTADCSVDSSAAAQSGTSAFAASIAADLRFQGCAESLAVLYRTRSRYITKNRCQTSDFCTLATANSTHSCSFSHVEFVLELSESNRSVIDRIVERVNEIDLLAGARDVQMLSTGPTYYAGRNTQECKFLVSGSTLQDGVCVCPQGQYIKTVNSQKTCTDCEANHWCDRKTLHPCPHPLQKAASEPWSSPSQCQCPPGTFQENSVCSQCPRGFFCPGVYEGVQKCADNAPISNVGAKSAGECFSASDSGTVQVVANLRGAGVEAVQVPMREFSQALNREFSPEILYAPTLSARAQIPLQVVGGSWRNVHVSNLQDQIRRKIRLARPSISILNISLLHTLKIESISQVDYISLMDSMGVVSYPSMPVCSPEGSCWAREFETYRLGSDGMVYLKNVYTEEARVNTTLVFDTLVSSEASNSTTQLVSAAGQAIQETLSCVLPVSVLNCLHFAESQPEPYDYQANVGVWMKAPQLSAQKMQFNPDTIGVVFQNVTSQQTELIVEYSLSSESQHKTTCAQGAVYSDNVCACPPDTSCDPDEHPELGCVYNAVRRCRAESTDTAKARRLPSGDFESLYPIYYMFYLTLTCAMFVYKVCGGGVVREV